MSNSASWGFTRPWLDRTPEPQTRAINMNQLGRVLTESPDPPVNLLFVYNCNPAATMPDQTRVLKGLAREDLFTVVFEQVMTDTALLADVVLPATTFLEGYDFSRALRPDQPAAVAAGDRSGGRSALERRRLRRPRQPPRALGRRRGSRPSSTRCSRFSASCRPSSARRLRDSGVATPPWDGAPVQFVDVFPRTADQKVHLCPPALDQEAPLGLYGYQPDPGSTQFPLALISPASERTISSTLGELPRPEVKLLLHPDDAAQRGIAENDDVRVWNEWGEVTCRAQVGVWTRRGTAVLPKGLWRRHTGNGFTANALAPDTLTDLGGGACFNDARVQVARV